MEKSMKFFKFLTNIGFCFVMLFAVRTFHESIPDRIYVEVGETLSYDFLVPVTVEMKEDTKEALLNQNPKSMRKDSEPSYYVTCKLFGIFPVKDIEVTLVEEEAVFAGGSQIGIYAKTKGILVIGMGEVQNTDGTQTSPAKNLIKKGDYIVSVNGTPVMEKEELAEAVDENGGKTEIIGLFRNEEFIEVAVNPVHTKEDKYMLGIWVRDDMAGIGTITFYRKNQTYGALGHPINDGDTGEMLKLEEGSLYLTSIIGVKRGESGNPGELSGIIHYGKENYIGTIEKNSEIGIYGILDGNLSKLKKGTLCKIGYKQDIKIGEASILSAYSGELKEYQVEIESLNYSGNEVNKGILLKVTDKELLEETGGIVQGMSGSPILQDGKIIGAVTHVLVNDPTRGYGIFIENMLEE